MIQEFHISVTPIGDDEYLVRTERVETGVPLAEEQVSWPVEDWLAQASQLIGDPLLSLLQVNAQPGTVLSEKASASPPSLVNLGQQFYNALFQGTVRDSWVIAQGIASNRREALRLRLGLKGGRLPRLPWEVLYADHRPLATGTDVVFSRYQPIFPSVGLPLHFPGQGGRGDSQRTSSALHILMVLASPSDQENLQLKQEVAHLQDELQKPAAPGKGNRIPEIHLTVLEQPDREQLTQSLEQGHYQVLHYAGHSNLAAVGGNLYLVNRKTGLTETLSGNDLAGLLANNGIRMAVFNSCRGAYTASSDTAEDMRERNLAEALVKRGIPAVLAMAERIPDDVALTLTRLFYRNLKQGYSVDLSLGRARQGLISAYGSHQLYWSLPTLYMHPEFDGFLVPQDRERSSTSATPLSSVASPLEPLNGTLKEPPAHEAQEPETVLIPVLPVVEETEAPSPSQGSTPSSGSHLSAPLSAALNLSSWDTLPPAPVDRSPTPSDFPMNETTHPELDESLTDLVDDLEYGEDLEPEDESTLVSRLILQLSSPDEETIDESSVLPAPLTENLLPDAKESRTPLYLDLPEAPPSRPSPAIANPGTLYPVTTHGFSRSSWQTGASLWVQCLSYTDWYRIVSQALNWATISTAPTRPVTTPVAAPTPPPVDADRPIQKSPPIRSRQTPSSNRLTYLLWPALGSLTAVVLLGLGLWSFPKLLSHLSRVPGVGQSLSLSGTQPTNQTNKAQVASTTTSAIKHLQQGDVNGAVPLVEQLLDQSALSEAKTALEQVRSSEANAPAINFLKGRLAYQLTKTGAKDYSLQDAQRFLQQAIQDQPQKSDYRNALGFVFYTSGENEQANQSWFQVLLSEEGNRSEGDEKQPPLEILTAKAGVALVLLQTAQRQTQERTELINEALKLQREVMEAKPDAFQPEALKQNWMWSDQAIADWKKLLDLKSSS